MYLVLVRLNLACLFDVLDVPTVLTPAHLHIVRWHQVGCQGTRILWVLHCYYCDCLENEDLEYLDILEMLYNVDPPVPQKRRPWVDDIKCRKGVWWRATIESVTPGLMDHTFHAKQKRVCDFNNLRISERKKKLVNPTQPADPAHRRALTRIWQRTTRG